MSTQHRRLDRRAAASICATDRRLWWGALVTSWFWLVGAVVLSLLPPLVKNVLGGTEEVVTVCLAIFSIAIAIGSGLAAWLAAGRIILLPTLIGAVLLGVFALDLGWATWGAAPVADASRRRRALFGSVRGIRVAIDLAGLAIAGGLFIVPTFAAVQAWAGADRRARVIAAVNVLNAAFMAAGALIVALLQTAGVTTPQLFVALGVASLLVAVAIGRTMPASALSDFLSIIFARCSAIEVQGPREPRQGRPQPHHRAQPRQLPRRRAGAVAAQPQAGVRHRRRHRAALVGEAVPEAHPRDAARSDQADGDAHADQRGQGRRCADHLSRRAASPSPAA